GIPCSSMNAFTRALSRYSAVGCQMGGCVVMCLCVTYVLALPAYESGCYRSTSGPEGGTPDPAVLPAGTGPTPGGLWRRQLVEWWLGLFRWRGRRRHAYRVRRLLADERVPEDRRHLQDPAPGLGRALRVPGIRRPGRTDRAGLAGRCVRGGQLQVPG